MSEPTKKSAKKSKETAAKPASESKSTDSASDSSSSSSGSSDSGGGEKGKSARESIGGAAEVHYGYFSNVKTPEYRSGWDSIWGDKNASDDPAPKKKARPRKKSAPITLSFDLEDLPAGVRDGLIEAARKALKKQRVSYERRDKAGDVDWRIDCHVKR